MIRNLTQTQNYLKNTNCLQWNPDYQRKGKALLILSKNLFSQVNVKLKGDQDLQSLSNSEAYREARTVFLGAGSSEFNHYFQDTTTLVSYLAAYIKLSDSKKATMMGAIRQLVQRYEHGCLPMSKIDDLQYRVFHTEHSQGSSAFFQPSNTNNALAPAVSNWSASTASTASIDSGYAA